MAQVLQQTVGNIDGGVRDAAQRQPQRHLRFGPFQRAAGRGQPRRVGRVLPVEQAIGHVGRAQFAGHPDVVVRPRAIAAQRGAGRHGAEHGHADGQVMGAAGGVAADQRAAMGRRQRMEPVGEGRQPRLVQARQRQPQHATDGPRAHGGQVRQVHRQGLVPQRLRIDIGKEMPAFQQQIGAGGHLFSGRHRKQRAVIPHAQQARRRGAREIARDQIEFGRHDNSAVRRKGR